MEVRDIDRCRPRQCGLLTVERVVGDVQPQHVAFEFKLNFSRPLWSLRYKFDRLVKQLPEVETNIALGRVFLGTSCIFSNLLVDVDERTARVTETIKGSCLDERLERSLVESRQRDSIEEILERQIRTVGLSLTDNVLDHCLTDVFDRPEPEADVVADCGEVEHRFVDVGRQHLDAHPPSLDKVPAEFLANVANAG